MLSSFETAFELNASQILGVAHQWNVCVRMQSWARDNFIASLKRQRNRTSGTSKIRKISKYRCLDGVATPNIVIL